MCFFYSKRYRNSFHIRFAYRYKLCNSFILCGDLYSASSKLLLRSARVKCVRKNTGEQSLRQRKPIYHTEGPTTENARPGLWRYEQKEQKVTPVPMGGVNCDLWCPGWDSKDLGGRLEQDLGYTSRPGHQYGYTNEQSLGEGVGTPFSCVLTE